MPKAKGSEPAKWICGECAYERTKTTGALPLTAACPRCGAEVAELRQEIEAAAEAAKTKDSTPET